MSYSKNKPFYSKRNYSNQRNYSKPMTEIFKVDTNLSEDAYENIDGTVKFFLLNNVLEGTNNNNRRSVQTKAKSIQIDAMFHSSLQAPPAYNPANALVKPPNQDVRVILFVDTAANGQILGKEANEDYVSLILQDLNNANPPAAQTTPRSGNNISNLKRFIILKNWYTVFTYPMNQAIPVSPQTYQINEFIDLTGLSEKKKSIRQSFYNNSTTLADNKVMTNAYYLLAYTSGDGDVSFSNGLDISGSARFSFHSPQ